MIPISDQPREARRLFPLVNLALIAANVLVFLWMLVSIPANRVDDFYLTWGSVPAEIASGRGYITILTSMFIHGGWLHIIGNMLYLWIFGDNVESAMGHIKYLLFYLLCGVAASLAQVVIDPTSTVPAVGASGAIAGVLGAYVLFYPSSQVRTLIFLGIFFTITRVSAILLIGFWIVLQLISGFTELGAAPSGGVAYFAHIGGFFVGLLLANLFRDRSQVGLQR
jgi:rhomboid family protein